MSVSQIGAAGAGPAGPGWYRTDPGREVVPLDAAEQPPQITRAMLSPGQEQLSLPDAGAASEPAAMLLAQWLGEEQTTANPAWSRRPVDAMRLLQKILLATALQRPEESAARADCLAAIRVVERNVRWRLRWQQMQSNAGDAGTGEAT